jgi:hypothetical protein
MNLFWLALSQDEDDEKPPVYDHLAEEDRRLCPDEAPIDTEFKAWQASVENDARIVERLLNERRYEELARFIDGLPD